MILIYKNTNKRNKNWNDVVVLPYTQKTDKDEKIWQESMLQGAMESQVPTFEEALKGSQEENV